MRKVKLCYMLRYLWQGVPRFKSWRDYKQEKPLVIRRGGRIIVTHYDSVQVL